MRSLERCLVLHNERGFGYAVTVNYTTRFCYVHLEYVSPLFYVLESVSSFIDSFVFFLGNNEPYCAKKKKGCRHGFEQCPPQSSECGKCKKKQICCCKEGDGGGGGGGKPHSLSIWPS